MKTDNLSSENETANGVNPLLGVDFIRTKVLDVPNEFYKDEYFQVDESELKIFLTNMIGYITPWGEAELDEIDINKTIKMHSGDCRIWYKDGCYNVLEAKQLIMKCDEPYMYDDIFEWLEKFIPSLFSKHFPNGTV